MGKEFAQSHPKIASRLDLTSLQTKDPYVERLLEGFAFLTARIKLRMDAQYPEFTQNLLGLLYPTSNTTRGYRYSLRIFNNKRFNSKTFGCRRNRIYRSTEPYSALVT